MVAINDVYFDHDIHTYGQIVIIEFMHSQKEKPFHILKRTSNSFFTIDKAATTIAIISEGELFS